METLYLSLKALNSQQIELRYWQGQRSAYEQKILAISEIEDLIGQSELDYYVLRPRLTALGQRLYDWLDGEGRWLSRAIQNCGSEGFTLAIAVEGKLAHLPWEVMHDGTGFVIEKPYPLVVPVRWVDQPTKPRSPQNRPLQILFMASSPESVQPVLNFEAEETEILRITGDLPLTLRVEESGCVAELNNLWRRYPEGTYDIFHLTGHADLQREAPHAPFFITEALTGERQDTFAPDLQKVFQTRPPRLIFLSGCRTGEAGQAVSVPSLAETLVQQGIPAVMGWGRPVLDTSATQAASWFYEHLASGEGLVQALGLTYQRLLKQQVRGWHLLRLYVRGTEWGAIVDPPGDYIPPPEPVQSQFLDYEQKVRVATPDQFVGRRRILQKGLRALKQSKSIGVMLHGIGGVGKSTVAARLLERLPEYQPIVIYRELDAPQLERLLFMQCTSELGKEILNRNLSLMQRLTAFLRQGLNEPQQRFILVLDDFEVNLDSRTDGTQVLKPEVVEVLMALMRAIAQSQQPHRVLITSRYDVRLPELNERIERIPLAALRGADLQKKCDRLEGFRKASEPDGGIQEKAKTIADGNPRLLEWLNKILLDEKTDPNRILDAMAQRVQEFREEILAQELLAQQSDEVRQILSRMQIYELPVPYSAVSAICQDIPSLNHHVQRATAIGLLECDLASGGTLYRLPRILTPLLDTVSDESFYQMGLNELYRLWWGSGCSEERAIELLRLADHSEHYEIGDEIASCIGRLWDDQGRYREAGSIYEQILEKRQKLLGQEHPSVATSLNDLAVIYDTQGRYEEAEALQIHALLMRKKLLGQEHPDVAQSLNNLAFHYANQGHYEKAEPLHIQSLQMRKKLLGQEHPDVAISLNNLASLYRNLGRYEEAEPLYTQALQMNTKLLGQEHSDVAISLNNLALLYYEQGRYEEAEPVYIQALQIWEKLFGQKHPHVAQNLNNLAELYKKRGWFEKAEPLLIQALHIRQKVFGQEHPHVATSQLNLGVLYANQGRYEEAESLYKQALQMLQKLLGQEHPYVATSQLSLGVLYANQGRYEEAESLYKQALQMLQRLLGQEHPDIACNLNNLAELYSSQGRYEEAESLYKQALQILQKLLGQKHPDIATSLNNLASLYNNQGRYEEAEPLYKQALQIRQRFLGAEHPDVAISLHNLGTLYQRQEKYSKAKAHYLSAIAIAQASLGPNHPHTQTMIDWLNSLPE
jgi:tetratricopeptide (TPR) repeat protein